MNRLLTYFVLVFSVIVLPTACQKPGKPQTASTTRPSRTAGGLDDAGTMAGDSSNLDDDAIREESRRKEAALADAVAAADTVAYIRFDEFIVSLSPLTLGEEDKQIAAQPRQDSVVLNTGVADFADGGLRLTVATDQFIDLSVEERVDVGLVVNYEDISGLIESTRSRSPWRLLRDNGQQEFISGAYRAGELMNFMGLSLQQVKQLVRQNGDSMAYVGVRYKRSLREVADVATIYAYQFRITGRRKDTGQTVTKVLILYPQIGC